MKRKPVRAIVIHNAKSGDAIFSKTALLKLLKRAGIAATYRAAKKKGYKAALKRAKGPPERLVIAAGGDGTVRRAALAVAGRRNGRDMKIAVLPLGTANNLAWALGIDSPVTASAASPRAAARLARGWAKAKLRRLDLGVAESPWGIFRFIEAAGFGWFPATMAAEERVDHRAAGLGRRARLNRHFQRFRSALLNACPFAAEVTVEGAKFAGRFVAIEAMNIRTIGPGLALAPAASPSDGRLDLVLIAEGERRAALRYFQKRGHGHPRPPFTIRRARWAVIRAAAAQMHIDDRLTPALERGGKRPVTVRLRVVPGAVEFLAAK